MVAASVNDILFQVKKLDKDDQLTLLELLVQLVRKAQNTSTPPARLTSLCGLASAVWKDTNILISTWKQKDNGS